MSVGRAGGGTAHFLIATGQFVVPVAICDVTEWEPVGARIDDPVPSRLKAMPIFMG